MILYDKFYYTRYHQTKISLFLKDSQPWWPNFIHSSVVTGKGSSSKSARPGANPDLPIRGYMTS